mgnify:CR=1 FL=1
MKNSVEIEVDLTKINVEMDEKHDARIQLEENPNIGILMSYPTIGTVGYSTKEDASNAKILFEMISNCMYQIWEGEETHDCMDYSSKEKLTFLESLSHNQFAKIQTFFETMPTLKHEVEIENPKTKVKSMATVGEWGEISERKISYDTAKKFNTKIIVIYGYVPLRLIDSGKDCARNKVKWN